MPAYRLEKFYLEHPGGLYKPAGTEGQMSAQEYWLDQSPPCESGAFYESEAMLDISHRLFPGSIPSLARIGLGAVAERATLISDFAKGNGILDKADEEIQRLSPEARDKQRYLAELTTVRDHVKLGLSLLAQKQSLADRRNELASIKPASKADKPRLGVSSTIAHEFAQTVSDVLQEWQFPGKRHVAFDEATYDLRIDGKLRRDNGKGVRAVTHAAFKVALLIFCRERGLPHPGFLVLDTPLLTYRDPIRSKEGALAADERELRNTSLRDFFFEHLASLSSFAQFIIVENIDPPSGIEKLGNTQVFTAVPGAGRFGLFPNSGA